MLKTERNTPTMKAKVLKAFRKMHPTSFGRSASNKSLEAFFEHGQWWIRTTLIYSFKTVETTYSVVDAEGGRSVDGFDFEEL